MQKSPALLAALLLGSLAACQQSGAGAESGVPGDASSREPYDGIAEGETLHFLGTEPFWGGEVTGGALTYDTPEDPDGTTISVERFPGRGGLSFHGSLEGKDFLMAVTPARCSDGMSDRTFPFAVTLQLGEELRNGCGYTEKQPFTGPETP